MHSNLAIIGLTAVFFAVIIFTYTTRPTDNSQNEVNNFSENTESEIQVLPRDSANDQQDSSVELDTMETQPSNRLESTTVTAPTPGVTEPVVTSIPTPETETENKEYAQKAAAYDETIANLPAMATSMIFENIKSNGLDPNNLTDQQKAFIYDQLVLNGIAQ